MPHSLAIGAILAVAVCLAAVAERREWAPGPWTALATGLVLRGIILGLAASDSWQPPDFGKDFHTTARNILAGHDPVLNIRDGGWHFLPLTGYLFAGFLWVGRLLGLSWDLVGRLPTMLADLALVPLVGRLATRRCALRRFQYACAPIPLMVGSLHGQIESIALAFGVGAFLAARARRPGAAGALLGLSVTAGSWPVLLVPGVLLTLRGLRGRLTALALTAVVPGVFFLSTPLIVGTPVSDLVPAAKVLLSTRPVVGNWGWSALATGGDMALSSPLARIGTLLLVVGLATTMILWRRAEPVDLTIAILLVFLVVTARFGTQYLMWPVPFLLARPTRGMWLTLTVAAGWAATGYLYLTRLHADGAWWHAHVWWAVSSVVVIPLLALTVPWRRRVAPTEPSAEPGALRRPEPAS